MNSAGKIAGMGILGAFLTMAWILTDSSDADSKVSGLLQDRSPVARSADKNDGQVVATLARIEARLQALEAKQEPTTSDDAKLEPEEATEPPAPRGPTAPERPQEILGGLETAIRAQPRDRAWDSEFRQNLDAALTAAQSAEVRLLDVRCGSTLCRADFEIQGNVSRNADLVLDKLASTAPHGDMWLNDAVLGPNRAVLFAARYGSMLPLRSYARGPDSNPSDDGV
jgi:hypothetical protein